MRVHLQLERTTLLNQTSKESNALDEALFRTTQDFLETFAKLSSNYRIASQEVKRQALELFFSKRSLERGKLLLKPKSIMKEISFSSNSTNGWSYNTKSETILAFKKSFLSLKKFIKENDLLVAIQNLNQGIEWFLVQKKLYT